MQQGTLYICATPIGNLDDITLRAIKTLEQADVVAAEDTRRTAQLLNHLNIKKPLMSYHEHNKAHKGELLIKKLQNGENIALVSDAGTPAISDPGEDLVRLCVEHGITVCPIPGACALVCALISSGISAGRFAFEGFLPMNKKERAAQLSNLKNEQRTMIFYEAPHKLISTLRDLYAALGDRRLALAREITKMHEEFIHSSLSSAQNLYLENPPRGEFALVVAGMGAAEQAAESPWLLMSVEQHVGHYTAQGIDQREAIKIVAKDRGVPKREVYNAINN